MHAPAFETFVTAMMCLCPNMGNITTDVRTHASSESIEFNKNEVIYLKDKMDSLEKSYAKILQLQEQILHQLNVNPKAEIPIANDPIAVCSSIRQIANIKVPNYSQSFQALCNGDIDGFGDSWLVIQQRYDGSENFFRSWSDYVRGFGNLQGEFFIGLEKLYAIASAAQISELIIIMEDFERDRRFAHYDQFEIGTVDDSYALKMLGKYTGNAGDSLRRHVTHKFSTYDRDNDIYAGNCAVEYTGAWWYDQCETSNLNGQYLRGQLLEGKYGKGMSWDTFRSLNYSLKSVKIMIRPKK